MNLKTYYQKRATEYELVYQKPERQADLKALHQYLKKAFKNKKILEIACGTGYWTKMIAETCAFIVAMDINEEVLNIAKAKVYNSRTVDFRQLDFWQLKYADNPLDSVFGGFIWSHILKKEIPQLLSILFKQIHPKGELIFIDNKYVDGSSTPISRTDEESNTYQIRKLQTGEEYEVLKNFSNEKEIDNLIKNFGVEVEWKELEYFWILKLKKSR